VNFDVTKFFFVRFLEFFNKATVDRPKQIFIQKYARRRRSGKEVPFGDPDNYISYLDNYITETLPFSTDFD